MAKAPAMQFYVKDWLADTCHLSLPAKGAWIQILCKLHLAKQRGRLTLPLASWALVFGCREEEADAILHELGTSDCATVTFRNSTVTVVSRRMERERKDKEGNALRQARHRLSQPRNEKLTSPSASASATAKKKPPIVPRRKPETVDIPEVLDTPEFRQAWAKWLDHRKEKKPITASSAEQQLKKLVGVGPEMAIQVLEETVENSWQGLKWAFKRLQEARQQAEHAKRIAEEKRQAEENTLAQQIAGRNTARDEAEQDLAYFKLLSIDHQEFWRNKANEGKAVPLTGEVLQRVAGGMARKKGKP